MPRTRGRRPGGLDTRSAILAEARRQFALAGYASTTLRSVAAGADVDPRLVLHYFGSKRGLFRAAVELPIEPATILDRAIHGTSGTVGERVATLALSVMDEPRPRQAFLGILRAAVVEPEAAALIRDVLTERMLVPIARELGADRPELRASMVASQLIGLIVARHVVRIEPVASASQATLVAALGPAMNHYLQGPWTDEAATG